jgi:hypothetical protein
MKFECSMATSPKSRLMVPRNLHLLSLAVWAISFGTVVSLLLRGDFGAGPDAGIHLAVAEQFERSWQWPLAVGGTVLQDMAWFSPGSHFLAMALGHLAGSSCAGCSFLPA